MQTTKPASGSPSKLAWLVRDANLADALLVLVSEGAAPDAASKGQDAQVAVATAEPRQQQPANSIDKDQAADGQEPPTKKAKTDTGSQPASGRAAQAVEDTARPSGDDAEIPEGVRLPVLRAILASHSEYFKARVSRNWAETEVLKSQGRHVLIERVEPDLVAAAEAVVWMMYEEVAPANSSTTDLVKMCRIADRWGALHCLGYCLERLTQLPEKDLGVAQLVQLLPQLPESLRSLPQHAAWEERMMKVMASTASFNNEVLPLLLYVFGDVHALLTSGPKLKYFLQLPYPAVKMWADSDDLVVDSENSVVVALHVWIEAKVFGAPARTCSPEQKEELSALLRVRHLSPDYLFCKLASLAWFTHKCDDWDCIRVAAMTATKPASSDFPKAWMKPARKQLSSDILTQRATTLWKIPRADVEGLMAKGGGCLSSPVTYIGGAGVQLFAKLARDDSSSPFRVGVFLQLAHYKVDEITAVTTPSLLSCGLLVERLLPGTAADQAQLASEVITTGQDTLTSKYGWGKREMLTLSKPTDLDPYLVDGCLQLRWAILQLR